MNHNRVVRISLGLAIALLLAGCSTESSKSSPAKAEAPAKMSGTPVREADLNSITLTPEAETRLGIRVEEARTGSGSSIRRLTGEITKPVGSNLVVSSPVAGTLQTAPSAGPALGASVKKDQPLFVLTPFLPLPRDLKVTAEGEVAQARARVEAARQRKARADRMLADQVGTVRAVEEAQQELDVTLAALQAAERRAREIETAPLSGSETIVVRAPQDGVLRDIQVVSGQTIAAGVPMFEIENLSAAVWVRVPVYAGEAQTILSKATVTVQALSGEGPSWKAEPVAAPPSADSSAGTVHLYYQLPNESLRFKPGEKVTVTLPATGSGKWIEIPWSAVVLDTNGGTWVYQMLGDRHYARRRVSVDHSAGGRAFLTAGLAVGTPVVAEGAAELWGFEFGTGK
ncbi:MAG TPA: efflux RND transporter periplasmic adaptor subunit [Terriglobia bacterium]|nr:efflux RND transporter periplasmic adaptor subunit [Terriglobia bacterium]